MSEPTGGAIDVAEVFPEAFRELLDAEETLADAALTFAESRRNEEQDRRPKAYALAWDNLVAAALDLTRCRRMMP